MHVSKWIIWRTHQGQITFWTFFLDCGPRNVDYKMTPICLSCLILHLCFIPKGTYMCHVITTEDGHGMAGSCHRFKARQVLKTRSRIFSPSQLIRKMANLQLENFKPSNFELRPLQHSKIYNRPKAGCIHMREPHRLLSGCEGRGGGRTDALFDWSPALLGLWLDLEYQITAYKRNQWLQLMAQQPVCLHICLCKYMHVCVTLLTVVCRYVCVFISLCFLGFEMGQMFQC